MDKPYNLYYLYLLDIQDHPIPQEALDRAQDFLEKLLNAKPPP